jgi:signal peptidase I
MIEIIDEIKSAIMNHKKKVFMLFIITASILTFFSPVQVQGISMYPTLKDKDFFIETYHFGQEIKRFDIVRAETDKSVIKRVIGIPGDTIKVSKKELYINGVIQKHICNNKEKKYTGMADEVEIVDNYEVCEENNYKIAFGNTGNNSQYLNISENNQEIKLNKNEYFLMGDNRLNSTDSRAFGVINKHQIKGIALK